MIGGTAVRITEETDYPFDETIRFVVERIENEAHALDFSLFLRVPSWAKAFELLLNGEPLNESIVGHGPFVMNTRQEIEEAIDDFNSGRFGSIQG